MGWVKAVAKVEEKIVCEAEIAFALIARDDAEKTGAVITVAGTGE
jgi:hypothetical protein